ncbi:MAG: AraC family transcriptional regulator [Synergistaceae bacterium]|jgi:AraC-like DNA-binding protein|nr:AraC family transcriptional regulator [Synergistaceae bacterium]
MGIVANDSEVVTLQPLWRVCVAEKVVLRDKEGDPYVYLAHLYHYDDELPSFPGLGMVGIFVSAASSGKDAVCWGVMKEPASIFMKGIRETYMAKFYPGQFTRTFGVPARLLSPVHGSLLRDIVPVRNSNDMDVEKPLCSFGAFANFILSLTQKTLARQNEDMREKAIFHMIREVLHMRGVIKVKDLEDNVGYSRRQICNILYEQVGITPKQFCSQVRFQSALNAFTSPVKSNDLSFIANECGYYDQSHLNMDFKRHTNMTPSDLLKTLTMPVIVN